MMNEDNKSTVLVTGFGPFDQNVVNASWESVLLLKEKFNNSQDAKKINLIIEEIPVVYTYVASTVPELWQKYNPLIVIHVGVSNAAECLVIEQKAHNFGYNRKDICEKCPDEKDIKCNSIQTEINLTDLCDFVNRSSDATSCLACTSTNAGRFLCEYIYYQSLCINSSRTLFIHVPDLNVYKAERTAKGLYAIIQYLIKTINKKEE